MTDRLTYSEATLDIILADYSEKTGKTLLRAPGLPTPTFTLRSQGKLSVEDYLKAIETVLTMHGVGLVEFGDNFVRVVPVKTVVKEGLEILETMPEGHVSERSGTMISQMVPLKHIDLAEAVTAIEPMRNENGQINQFERTNAIMITDFAENINRMLQVLRLIDQPIEAKEEPNIIQIRYAKASEIKSRLEEIIADSQKELEKKSTVPRAKDTGAPGVVQATPSGIIRPTRNPQPATPEVEAELVEAAERGIIRGKVQIVADERTNQLIIITRRSNMAFFERIIAVLDVETSPDVMVKVRRLEFALAEEVAGMLNDLIGATKKDDGGVPAARGGTESTTESKRLAEIEAALRSRQANQPDDRKSSVGELSKDNIKILSDKRTNSLILMASKADMVTLEEIILDMDMMLSQVLIEAVIIEVNLDENVETGVSWVQKSMTAYSRDSAGKSSPVFSFAGGGGGGAVALDATQLSDPATLTTGGLGYYFTLYDLNLNMILKASAGDSRTRVVSTPALLTTDNTEAKLTSTELIYVYKGESSTGTSGEYRNFNYDQKEVGLVLTVKPQINENQVVMMAIKQEISEPGSITGADTENLTGQTISINRVIEASVAVKSGQTIVLGGAVRESDSRSRTKIPLLGDIPILGRLFNSDRRGSGRTETIVFITPYVLDTVDQVDRETKRRRDSLNIEGMWKRGWSGSELAEPAATKSNVFPRTPAATAAREPDGIPAPRPVTRVEPWTSSDGKVARSGKRDESSAPPKEEAPVDPVSPVAADDKSPDDVDTFIRAQRQKWDKAVQGAP